MFRILFKVSLMNFHLYIFKYDTRYFIRGEELCQLVGYKSCNNAIRRNYPFEKKTLKELGYRRKNIRFNSIFISFEGALHIIQKSKVSVVKKKQVKLALKEKLITLENIIKTCGISGMSSSFEINLTDDIPSSSENRSAVETISRSETLNTCDLSMNKESLDEIPSTSDGVIKTEQLFEDKEENAIKNETEDKNLNIHMHFQPEKELDHLSETIDILKNENDFSIKNSLKKILEMQNTNIYLSKEILKKLN